MADTREKPEPVEQVINRVSQATEQLVKASEEQVRNLDQRTASCSSGWKPRRSASSSGSMRRYGSRSTR